MAAERIGDKLRAPEATVSFIALLGRALQRDRPSAALIASVER
jgi:hypothetical protein